MRNFELYGKRRGCCPGGNHTRLNENRFNSSIYRKAAKKLLNECTGPNSYEYKAPKRNSQNKQNLAVAVKRALNENRSSLYENKMVCGQPIKKISDIVLTSFCSTLRERNNRAGLKLKNHIYESLAEKEDIKNDIERRLKDIRAIEEELSYRSSRRFYLNEGKDEDEDTDDSTSDSNLEKLFGPGQGNGDNDDDSDGGDEVELSKIVVTMASEEDAEELKQHCVDAGIPEEAIDIVTENDDEDDEEENDESDEESEEESEESEEESEDEEKNESVRYRKSFRRLYESDDDEESDDDSEEGDDFDFGTDEGDGDGEESEDEDNDEETEEDKEVPTKVVLTDTDYAEDFANVLNDVYGVSQEEFNNMIGGEIVSEDNSDDDEDTESIEDEDADEDDDDDSDESADKKSDKKSKKSEDEDDEEIDVNDIFKGL